MMMLGPIDEATIAKMLTTLEAMLRDPTVRVSWSRGVHHRADDAGQWMVAEPTAGETITIDVHGGAVETTETAEERLQRLIDLERAER